MSSSYRSLDPPVSIAPMLERESAPPYGPRQPDPKPRICKGALPGQWICFKPGTKPGSGSSPVTAYTTWILRNRYRHDLSDHLRRS